LKGKHRNNGIDAARSTI